ncbi:MAG: AraC family transcriptional regulator of adaptative response [Candidatus Latescibacterota bacterium]|jgi:AraC family transcriptional regulator of adaptative response/methylated-DNA-[protein]-cysteine methyltransferase
MIFCRTTCSARKPKAENVVFYESVKEALSNGYRPCKVCKPTELPGSIPGSIQAVLQDLNDSPYHKIRDCDLVKKGIEPNALRRWFKKNYNMTFHAYQRMLKMNGAFQKITVGEPVTRVAFDNGYESLSGFNERYKSIFGKAPTKISDKGIINIVRLTTPLGPMFACATKEGVCLLEFSDRKELEPEFNALRKRLNATILPGTNSHLQHLQNELAAYFTGQLTSFTVALFTPGTPFQN